MLTRKTLLSNFASEQASLFKKKLGAFLIFVCMLINGFAFSTVEIGKHSLFMITIGATQNIVSSVISKYNDSLAEVSNKVYVYIGNLLFDDTAGSGMASNKGDESGKKNSESGKGGASGIIIKSPVKEIKRIMLNDNEKAVSGFALAENICNKNGSYRISMDMSKGLLFILFLVFIAAIRHRKGIGESINVLLKNIRWKTRISA